MSIGESIRKLRKARGLTQNELAEKANLSRSYIADIERDRYNPSIDTLVTIANALNSDLTQLLQEFVGISVELSERLRVALMDLSEGPYHKRSFIQEALPLIETKLRYIETLHQVRFRYTPASIFEICKQSKDEALVVEVIKALEEVIEAVHSIETIAAHRNADDDEEWTEEELKQIEEFKEFVRSRRKQNKGE